MTDLYEFLTSIAQLQENTWQEVTKLFGEKELPKGAFFAEEGRVATQIGFLRSGIIRSFYRGYDGQEVNNHFFTDNSIVGDYASLITRRHGKLNLQALTDSRLLVATYADIQKLYDRYPDVERLGRRLTELFFIQREERNAAVLLLEPEKLYRLFRQQFPSLEKMVAPEHIASYLHIPVSRLTRIQRKYGV